MAETIKRSQSSGPRIPIRHLSVRAPWHDAGWDGPFAAPHGRMRAVSAHPK